MSKKNTERTFTKDAVKRDIKRAKRNIKNGDVGISEELRQADPGYWEQPLWKRAYLRVLYAAFAFVLTVYVFDMFTPSPIWLQVVMGICISIIVLCFRMAYPGGSEEIRQWIMEGMMEAALEQESKGKTNSANLSSEEIKALLDARKGGKKND